jgi:hypothetical protein
MLDCAVKPMAAARSRMCFIIIISDLSFRWGFFSAEAWPSDLIDQLQHTRAIECRLQPNLAKPKAVIFFFYSSHLPPFNEHVATLQRIKFRKNLRALVSRHRKFCSFKPVEARQKPIS